MVDVDPGMDPNNCIICEMGITITPTQFFISLSRPYIKIRYGKIRAALWICVPICFIRRDFLQKDECKRWSGGTNNNKSEYTYILQIYKIKSNIPTVKEI
ncbi:hypothetical protein V6Z11_D12G083500 [Gossypium hirsutum]